ncbi:BTB/POZ domain-containing protein 6-B-like [Paramacrobiotus metropolitanus]|uniref:BTB/POZ domain-containing protein 6-B-like n=1 Tax=Paramacrobiotus metropolitanus TaxID=2943436 RepID=UPI002445717B|nr:BTB/POZ domain-containing protein 6-B-like [Paramacrobiotus metropolitanus]
MAHDFSASVSPIASSRTGAPSSVKVELDITRSCGWCETNGVDNLNLNNVLQTLNCAEKYELAWLVGTCISFILGAIDTGNCVEILEKAIRYLPSSPMIMEECLCLIDESAEVVWQSDHFLAIGQEALQVILQRETLTADEHTIYSSVEKWATSACSQSYMEPSAVNRREKLGPALYHVRFPLLTNEQLMDGPAKTGLLVRSELCDIFSYKHSTDKPCIPFRTIPRQGRIIYFSVPDVRVLQDTTTFSDPVTVRKLLWKIGVAKRTRCESANMGFFLHCFGYPKSASWKCQVNAQFCLLPWKTGIAPIKKDIFHPYDQKSDSWGYLSYISMEELLDPAKGYVNPTDFSLKLQIQLAVELSSEFD